MAQLFHPNRIAWKVIKALVVFSSVLTLLATALQMWMEYGRDIDAIDSRFVQVERSYVDAIAVNVWTVDQARLQLQVDGIVEFPDFAGANIHDMDGAVLAQAGELTDAKLLRQTYPLYFTFRGERRLIGHLEVAASLTHVYARMVDRLGLILLSNAVKTFLVAIFLFLLVFWLLTRHLETLARYARRLDFSRDMADLHLDRGRHYGGRDELDDLADAFNEMKAKMFDAYEDARQLSQELEVRVRGRTRALNQEGDIRRRTAERLAESESRLRDIAEAGSDWIWEMGPDLRFTYISEGASKSGALNRDDIVGLYRSEYAVDLNDRGKWQAHLDDLNHHRPFRDFEYTLQMPSGARVSVRDSGKPIFDDTGAFKGYRGLSTNITGEVQAKEKALQAQDQLRVLSLAIEQNPSAVFITNRDGSIEFVNDQFTKLTGYSADEVIGENPRILKSIDTLPDVHEEIWRHITMGREWRGEIKDRHKNGSAFWAYATIAPVKNANGEITHFVATHEDITERKQVEERLRNAIERAEVASRTKSELMANMSHELRTPLNAIIGFSDTILNGVFGALNNARYEEYLHDIHDSGKHLLELINDILDVSAIEAGKLELHLEPLDVEDVVRSSLRLVQHRADANQIKLDLQIEPNLPGLMGDARRIKQVLLNLLSNAVKFTPEHGRVTLTASTLADGGLCIEVIDTGIGMDDAGLVIALTQFGQVDSKLARKYEGTGLGLPLSKSMVEAHNGTLEIRSRLGHGTKVRVCFPPESSIASIAMDLPGQSGRAEGRI
jgi:PAS domain S-box-containing protein